MPDASMRDAKSVRGMFTKIAPSYDLMNRVISLGMDAVWRRRLVAAALEGLPQKARVLDMACGSGEVSFALWSAFKKRGLGVSVMGADFCEGMLKLARVKMFERGISPNPPEFLFADCADLPFADETFDAVTIAFGLRNFKKREKCLMELARVLKPGGKLCVLEVSRAPLFLKNIQDFLMAHIIPNIAFLLGCDRDAYKYLAETTRNFPDNATLCRLINALGFAGAKSRAMAFGAVALTTAQKAAPK